ncbi:MAG: adenine-specific DNA-methyltransferase [Candidatus Hodarchaeales archaeon]|jgi:site-specific DNA-methyltransferase (adenine-specific)
MERFEKDNHIIIWGDVLEELRKIENESCSLIFADPPYNIGKFKKNWSTQEEYLNWCYTWIDLCILKLKTDGSMYLMSSTQNMPYLDIYLRRKMSILSRIVWHYDSSGVQAKKYFGSLYEPILFAVKNSNSYTFNAEEIMVEAKTGAKRKLIDYRKHVPKQYNTKKVPGNVWNFPRVRYRMTEYEDHPSQKPEALLERIIKVSSNKGDLVLDPFAGTFTTGFIAKKFERDSINIEHELDYVKIGLRRLSIQDTFRGQKLFKRLKSYEVS